MDSQGASHTFEEILAIVPEARLFSPQGNPTSIVAYGML